MPLHSEHTLLICATCQGTQSAQDLRRALLAELPSAFTVRFVDCLAGCDAPVTVGFQAPHKAQYLFGHISTPDDLAALAAFARQYHNSTTGWTRATERPPALLHKTLARLPALVGQKVAS